MVICCKAYENSTGAQKPQQMTGAFYINYFEKYNVSALKSVVRNAILHNVVINWKNG